MIAHSHDVRNNCGNLKVVIATTRIIVVVVMLASTVVPTILTSVVASAVVPLVGAKCVAIITHNQYRSANTRRASG